MSTCAFCNYDDWWNDPQTGEVIFECVKISPNTEDGFFYIHFKQEQKGKELLQDFCLFITGASLKSGNKKIFHHLYEIAIKTNNQEETFPALCLNINDPEYHNSLHFNFLFLANAAKIQGDKIACKRFGKLAAEQIKFEDPSNWKHMQKKIKPKKPSK